MFGLIDCDNFFCSCERVFRPDLANTPIVVLSNNDGCVVARSAEVKAMGVPEGLPYFQLKERFGNRGIVAFSSNYTLYGDLSARVMQILRQEAPDVIQYSIDEAFLDLSGMDHLNLKEWGEKLCAKVKKSTGISISLGIAATKTLAKVACKFAKKYPGYHKCCVIVTDDQRRKALSLFPARDVWGIGRRIAARLEQARIATALDFADAPKAWVRMKFHVTGERTWAELNGTPAIELEDMGKVKKQSIVTSRSFPGMITDLADLKAHVANYAARCSAKLRRQKSVCSSLTVFISSNHFREDLPQYDSSGLYTFPTATATTQQVVAAAIATLERIYRKGFFYKRAGVMVADITDADVLQPDLFSYDPERSRKEMILSGIADSVNRRSGADTLVLGMQHYRETDAEGKRLKFAQAIRRSLKSPDYSTTLGAFKIP